MNSVCFNGKMIPAGEPVLLASNRGYRYGDGLFETIKVVNGKIRLSAFHFERLFAGLFLLKYEVPKLLTIEKLVQEIEQLCRKNDCEKLARVRLSVSRGNGGLYEEDQGLQYLIECWPLNASVSELNENGLMIDTYPGAEKNCDVFSNLKSANFQVYTMAALFAKEKKLNDCLVINTTGTIADSTIANVFLISGETIITPPLDEGCINGVMRRHLLSALREAGLDVQENAITINDLKKANEVFLTNAINGIRWVRQFRDSIYSNSKTVEIYNRFIKTISA